MTEMFVRDIREGIGDTGVKAAFLTHDAACYMDFFSGEAGRAALAQAAPNWHYEHISDEVLPALRESGVSDEQLTTMLVDNPRRYFTPRS